MMNGNDQTGIERKRNYVNPGEQLQWIQYNRKLESETRFFSKKTAPHKKIPESWEAKKITANQLAKSLAHEMKILLKFN